MTPSTRFPLRDLILCIAIIGISLQFSACRGSRPTSGTAEESPGSTGSTADEEMQDAAASEAGLRQKVLEAHEALADAFETGDAEAFAALLDRSPALSIFHPVNDTRFDTIEQAEKGLKAMFELLGKASWNDFLPAIHVRGEVAWVTSHVVIESESMEKPFVGRGTEIWVRHPEGWRMIHGHWSSGTPIWNDVRTVGAANGDSAADYAANR